MQAPCLVVYTQHSLSDKHARYSKKNMHGASVFDLHARRIDVRTEQPFDTLGNRNMLRTTDFTYELGSTKNARSNRFDYDR